MENEIQYMNRVVMVLMALMMFVAFPVSADLYDRQPNSWVWYKDPAVEAPKPKPEEKKVVPGATASPAFAMSAKDTLKKLGDEYEEAEAQAVLNPTNENIVREMTLKKQIMVLGETYADRVQQVTWKNPNLDYTLERPMTTDALFTANPVKQEKINEQLASVAKHKAIVYVFRSDCPYCKRFSPILNAFAKEKGFTVLTFSLDGRGNDIFPYPKTDLALLHAKNILPQVVPAVYLIDPRADTTDVIGFGLMNYLDLQNRISLASGIKIYEGITSSVSNAGGQQ